MELHAKLAHAAICGVDDPEWWIPRSTAYELLMVGELPPDFCKNCERKLPEMPPTPGEPEFIDP